MAAIIALMLSAATLAGIAYTLVAAMLLGRWRAGPAPRHEGAPPVVLLKPLHGLEPDLAGKLGSFLAQDYPAPVAMVCGVADPDDPAARVARDLAAGGAAVTLVVDATRHGANAKVSNLVNMAAAMPAGDAGDLVVLSDDDIVVPHDYLARIAAALASPAVGCVTCLYAGRGDAGFWSRIAAAGISWQFLPSVMVGLATGLARPCMGSTIAMRRETLAAIGGLAPFADLLADDHAIGEAVRARGLAVAVPALVVTHGCSEAGVAALFRHEVRWHATVRALDPLGHAGSVVTHPLPLALLAWAAGAAWWWPAIAAAARLVVVLRVDRLAGRRTAPLWTLPLRDMLGFAAFLAAFVARSVDWRGQSLSLASRGRVGSARRPPE